MQILIVEDDEATLRLLEKVAESRGHQVTLCRTGEEAWKAYQVHRHPMVLIDWLLPGLNGLELCQRIRGLEHGRYCILLVITVRDEPEDLQAVLDAGADDYLAKPIDVGLLRVRLTIGENRARQRGEQRRAELARNHLKTQLQFAQKLESLGVMAGGMAHDFNNLLMAILGNASLAMMELSKEHPAHGFLEHIQNSALRAADLTNQLLAYSGKGKFIVESVVLSDLLNQMESLLDTVVSKRVQVRIENPGLLPPVEADVAQMRQLIMNLVTNASEAYGENGGEVIIRTESGRATRRQFRGAFFATEPAEGDYVKLMVEDHGCGIDPENVPKLFDPFYTTKFTGRGLGLAAVLGIVNGHLGAIHVQSKPGERTVFTVYLPAAETPEPPPARSVEPPAESNTPNTVLVVDDEEPVRNVTRMVLERFGYDVIAAPSGEQALELFEAHAPEISAVLLDLTMPGMDGVKVYDALNQIQADVPIILASGYAEDAAKERFEGKALAGFIQKPFRPTQLIAELKRVLGGGD